MTEKQEFTARYIGLGCFRRRDAFGTLMFVSACRRPEWLVEGEVYTLRAVPQQYGFLYEVVE